MHYKFIPLFWNLKLSATMDHDWDCSKYKSHVSAFLFKILCLHHFCSTHLTPLSLFSNLFLSGHCQLYPWPGSRGPSLSGRRRLGASCWIGVPVRVDRWSCGRVMPRSWRNFRFFFVTRSQKDQHQVQDCALLENFPLLGQETIVGGILTSPLLKIWVQSKCQKS